MEKLHQLLHLSHSTDTTFLSGFEVGHYTRGYILALKFQNFSRERKTASHSQRKIGSKKTEKIPDNVSPRADGRTIIGN